MRGPIRASNSLESCWPFLDVTVGIAPKILLCPYTIRSLERQFRDSG